MTRIPDLSHIRKSIEGNIIINVIGEYRVGILQGETLERIKAQMERIYENILNLIKELRKKLHEKRFRNL